MKIKSFSFQQLLLLGLYILLITQQNLFCGTNNASPLEPDMAILFDDNDDNINTKFEEYRHPDWTSYVKKKYEHTLFNKQCVYYPAKSPKRLIINFSFWGDRYMMWSWFWRQNEDWETTSYLFLKDAAKSWYFGTHDQPLVNDFASIIKHFIKLSGVTPDHVFTIGISMGGTAAIFYATLLGLKGTIVDLPQIIPSIWNIHAQKVAPSVAIGPNIAWVDLPRLLTETKNIPHISIHYGNCEADYLGAYQLIDAVKTRKSVFTVRRSLMPGHFGDALTASFIDKEIDYIDTQEQLSLQ